MTSETEATIGLTEFLLAVAIPTGGWFGKVIWDKIGRIERNIVEIQTDFHDRFVRRDDYKSDLAEIKQGLDRIYQKLDHKADKS